MLNCEALPELFILSIYIDNDYSFTLSPDDRSRKVRDDPRSNSKSESPHHISQSRDSHDINWPQSIKFSNYHFSLSPS